MNMDTNNISIQSIPHPSCIQRNIQLDVLRLDTIHPIVSGNKWFKLKHNVEAAIQQGKPTILTFGGAFSNHLHATAAYCKQLNIPCIGIVRGEELTPISNPTLADCAAWGMKLHFVSRDIYKHKQKAACIQDIIIQNNAYLIPEGGHNNLGALGVEDFMKAEYINYDYIMLSVGSGTTIAGVCNFLSRNAASTKVLGFSPMKGGKYMYQDIQQLLIHNYKFELTDNYHFGGFGKSNDEIQQFISFMNEQYQLPLDPVYTAKMFWGIIDMIECNQIPSNVKILAIHTGGLQGNAR